MGFFHRDGCGWQLLDYLSPALSPISYLSLGFVLNITSMARVDEGRWYHGGGTSAGWHEEIYVLCISDIRLHEQGTSIFRSVNRSPFTSSKFPQMFFETYLSTFLRSNDLRSTTPNMTLTLHGLHIQGSVLLNCVSFTHRSTDEKLLKCCTNLTC